MKAPAAAIAALVFLAVLLLFLAVVQEGGRRRNLIRRLGAYAHSADVPVADPPSKENALVVPSGLAAALRRLLGRRSRMERLQDALTRAGLPLRPEEFLGLALVVVLLPTVLLLSGGRVLAALATFLVLALLPLLFLKWRSASRLKALDGQVAEALVVMANGLRAGFSFLQVMDNVARETPPPLGGEFARTLRRVSLGGSLEEALEEMATRSGSKDLELVTIAVLIQRQAGGNLAEVLDKIAETVRERHRIRGEVRTLTAQGRISGLIISALPLVLAAIISVLNPGYLNKLVDNPLGLLLLSAAVLGEVLGIVIIQQVVKVDI